MQRIRGFYFYTVGTHMRAIGGISVSNKLSDKFYDLSVAKTDLEALLRQVLMPLRTARQSAINLLTIIDGMLVRDLASYEITPYDVFALSKALSEFEVAYNAENSIENLFYVTPKECKPTLIQAKSSFQRIWASRSQLRGRRSVCREVYCV